MDELLTEAADTIEDVLTRAKIALVAALPHIFDSCNVGMGEACFICEGLYAVGRARGELWQRAASRTHIR